jgi:hypothetical protein
MIAVPCMLLAAMILSSMANLVSRRWAHVIAPAAVVVILATTGRLFVQSAPEWQTDPFEGVRAVMGYLRDAGLSDDTRLYATPNGHLVMTYYTGLPIQSVAPIRKTFLDSYPGPVVIIRKAKYAPPPGVGEVVSVAGDAGVVMAEADAVDWVERIYSRVQREEVVAEVGSVRPKIVRVPEYLAPILEGQRVKTREMRDMLSWHVSSSLMFRGYTIRTSPNWWQTYKYRFVDPGSRSGVNVNYADRVMSAVVVALPRGRCMVYHCPPLVGAE